MTVSHMIVVPGTFTPLGKTAFPSTEFRKKDFIASKRHCHYQFFTFSGILEYFLFRFVFVFVLSRWPVSWENVGCWNHPLLLSFILCLVLVWKPSVETHVGIFYFVQRVLSLSVQKPSLFLLHWPSALEMSHNDLVVFPFVRATWSCFAWV